jgi:O-antigen ligase
VPYANRGGGGLPFVATADAILTLMRKPTPISLLVALAALSPFAFLPAPVLQESPRFAALLVVAGAAVALWAARLLAPADARWRSLALPGAAVALAAALSSAFAFSPALALSFGAERSLLPLSAWLAMLAVFLVAARIPLGRDAHAGLVVAGVVAVAMAAWAFVQGAGGGSAETVFGNADYMGVVILLFLPVAVVSLWSSKRPFAIALSVAALVVLVAAALVGGVITVLVALTAEALLFLGLSAARFPRLAKLRAPAVYGGLGVFGLGVLGVILGALAEAYPRAFAFASPIASQATFVTRFELWRAAWRAFVAHLILGAGPDGLPLASQSAITAKLMTLEGAIGYGADVLVRDPHSLPLLMLSTVGLLGTCALLWLALVWTRTLAARLREGDRLAAVRGAYASAVFAFLFAMLLIPWTVRYAALPALLAGLAVAPSAETKPAASKRTASRKPAAKAARDSRKVAAVIAALALVVAAAAYGARPILGDQAIGRAKAATTTQAAHDGFAEAVALQPTRPYPRYELEYLAGYRLAAESVGTPAEYHALVDGSPKEILGNGPYLGLLVQPALDEAQLTKRADLRWETERLDRALALAPTDPDIVLEEAHLALLQGRLEDAAGLLARIRAEHSPNPRLALYEALLKAARKEPDAQTALDAVAAESPDLAYAAHWPGR